MGATGFISSLFIKFLIFLSRKKSINIRVLGIARSVDKVQHLYKNIDHHSNFKFYYCDLLVDFPIINEPVDYIIHSAGITQSKSIAMNPVETINTSIYSLNHTLKLAEDKKSNVVYLSSVEVYGQILHDQKEINELDLGYLDLSNTRNCYGESKRLCEILCHSYAEEFSVNVKIARLAQVFGAGVLVEDNRVFAQFAKSVIQGQNIILHTNGQSEGNYCYTGDVIAAILTLLMKGKKGNVYNVSNTQNHMTILEMAQLVANHFGGTHTKVIFDIPANPKVYSYPPISKVYMSAYKINQLGWHARIDLVTSYQRMIEYMKTR